MPNPRALQNRWALVVGIDKYPKVVGADLDGCVRDARGMARLLEERFGFPRTQTTVLLDEQATRAAILSALERLLAKVGADDAVVVHFSGHGSQRSMAAGDRYEGDALEETLVPCDSGHAEPDENRDIGSAELRGWICRITKITPCVTLILDCCHSGTVARIHDEEKPPPKIRQILPDRRKPSPGSHLRDMKGGPAAFARYVVLAACRNKECAFEVPDGGGHGAFTWHLLQELAGLPRGACPTWRDVFEPVAGRVHDLFEPQQPQLEGVRDRELFGLAEMVPDRFVPITGFESDRAVLGAGATCGLREGSLWTVHPPHPLSSCNGDEVLGRVRIVEVHGTTSTACILEETKPGAIVRWSRAVQLEDPAAGRLMVSLDAGTDLAERVRRSPLLWPADKGEIAAARARLVDGLWAVTDPSGKLLLPRHPANPVGEKEVVEGLEAWARYRSALGLHNDGSPLDGKVDFNVARQQDGLWVRLQDGDELVEREAISFAVINHHSEPLHVYILDFGLTGGICLIHPAQGVSDPLAPDHSIEIGTRRGDEIDLFIPEGIPYEGEPCPGEVVGEEILKVFVSTCELDLAPLFQPGARQAMRGGRDFRFNPGDRSRGPEDDWTTFERRFRLKRRPVHSR